ncbi:MAG: hypothetical protein KDE57_06255 [Calditrichaeota bacterium]|nr:hypothetical protein [Calditrichota bacterium]MCB9070335.1 hypothetical protein [Calditrichia bacterium]
MIRKFSLIAIVSTCFCCAYAQEIAAWDTVDIRYRRAEVLFSTNEDVITIKVPTYLNKFDVMEQIKLAVQFPGTPPPEKKTTVFVLRDDQNKNDKTKNCGIYKPGKGYQWRLDDWQQDDAIFDYEPSEVDKLLYNTILDSMYAQEISPLTFEENESDTKKQIAKMFEKSVAEVDSIYFRVMWWRGLQAAKK